MLSYDDLVERNRSLERERRQLESERRRLEALLRAEQDRARDESERRQVAEEQKALALRQLEELRRSYAILLQEKELLRRRIFEARAERIDPTQLELEFAQTQAALDQLQRELEAAAGVEAQGEPGPSSPQKRRPTGRRRLDETTLPVETVVLADPAMEALVRSGEAEVIGADVASTIKYRRGSMVRFVTEKPTYRVIKNADGSETTLVTAAMPPTIIARSIGTPSLYAHIATDKFDRGLPLYRQQEEFEDLGVPIDRGLMSRWMEELGATLGATVLHAMRKEALATAMCLSTDATGVLVQRGRDPTTKARQPCKKGHYFVQIADRDAVFFEYTERETSAAVLEMFRGFSGYVQADAKSVFDILFREPDTPPDDGIEPDPSVRRELGCWSHARRYFFEAAAVAKEVVAREALLRIRRLFEMDARWKDLPPQKRKQMRQQFLAPELDLFFAFVRAQWDEVQHQRGLLRSALGYAKNQEAALRRFLEDGRLKMDNNASERALRKVAVGRNYPQLPIMRSFSPVQSAARLRPIRSCAYSQPFEKGEQVVARSEAHVAGRGVRERGEGTALHRQVGLDVAMGRRGALVSEPQRDHGEVDARLQQVHRRPCVISEESPDRLGSRILRGPGGSTLTVFDREQKAVSLSVGIDCLVEEKASEVA